MANNFSWFVQDKLHNIWVPLMDCTLPTEVNKSYTNRVVYLVVTRTAQTFFIKETERYFHQ